MQARAARLRAFERRPREVHRRADLLLEQRPGRQVTTAPTARLRLRVLPYLQPEDYCYHFGSQFWTTHPAFQLALEQSVRALDPSFSSPYWDFMLDSKMYGADWWQAEAFSDSWFGPVATSADEDYVLTSGPFAYTKAAWDHGGSYVGRSYENVFGVLTSDFDETDSKYIQRSNAFSASPRRSRGRRAPTWRRASAAPRPSPTSTSASSTTCTPTCTSGRAARGTATTTSRSSTRRTPLSVAFLEWVGANSYVLWLYAVGDAGMPAIAGCPKAAECATKDAGKKKCRCTCAIDVDALARTELVAKVNRVHDLLYTHWQAHNFLALANTSAPSAAARWDGATDFKYAWRHACDDGEQTALNMWLLNHTCHVGQTGHATSLGSPNDPLFWVIHPIFDNMLHVLRMSPDLEGQFDMSWVSTGCHGAGWDDALPFKDLFPNTTHMGYYTNRDLFQLLTPGSPSLPYVYDSFDKWGGCSWDPCPTCA